MTTNLEIIARLIKEHDDEDREELRKARPHPFTITDYVVPPFVIPKTRDKKQINEFRKILTFIKKKAQYNRKKFVCTVFPISSTDKSLLKIWSNVHRGRKLMDEIGLIRTYSDEFKRTGKATFAKRYMWFYENEVKFLEYCDANGIEPLDIDLSEGEEEAEDEGDSADFVLDETKVRIGKGLYLRKPTGMSCGEFEKKLLEVFKKNYPEYQHYADLVREINEKYYSDKPEFAITFKPSFKWNKKKTKVMKIGIRATNPKCNEEKEYRSETRKNNGFVLDFDVNGSVPRLNSSMNMGRWNDDPRDIYELIFHECYPDEEFTQSARDAMKQLLLRGYFEKSADLLTRDVWNAIDHDVLSNDVVKREMVLLDQAIKKVAGPKIYGSEIFYIESCVYLGVLKDLLDGHENVWLLYDGLYSDGIMMSELYGAFVEGLIKIYFDRFYKLYMSNRQANQ